MWGRQFCLQPPFLAASQVNERGSKIPETAPPGPIFLFDPPEPHHTRWHGAWRLFKMMRSLQRVAVPHVGVMRRLFVVAAFMVGRCFAVMFGGRLMMMGSRMMMFTAFVCHGFVLKPAWFMRILPPLYDMVVNVSESVGRTRWRQASWRRLSR
jgi:hypothetical protein